MNDDPRSSRRDFLAAGALAAAGAALSAATSSLRAADDAAQPQASGAAGSAPATLRWGIIGTGTRGAFTHIPVLKEAPESQVVALCDVAESRLQSSASKIGHPVATYAGLALRHAAPRPRGPFNLAARRAAGFSEAELALLG